ncbi:MAG TPA: GNAT family protein [Gammaproteobacteria bacterium]|nr:GNAT family protein [Gammaproteobacteria bacterium]
MMLEGNYIRLEPLSLDHLDALCEVGLDEAIWQWSPLPIRSRNDMRAYVEAAIAGRKQGHMLPFATVERATGRVAGSTRFGAIDAANRRLEIGWTWIAPPWQRTAVNTEAKLLMLAHAFEVLSCHRVEFKTDRLNERSRNAVLRLGAKEEGTLRKHMVTASGRLRDSVYFSILDDEWPAVKAHLQRKLPR